MDNRLKSLIIKGNIEKIIADENFIRNVWIESSIIFLIKLKFNNLTDFSNLTNLPSLQYLDNNNLNHNLRVTGINLGCLDLQNNNLETLTITGTIYNVLLLDIIQ